MSAELEALNTQVSATVAAQNAAVTALQTAVTSLQASAGTIASLSSQLEAATANAADPTLLTKLTGELKTASDALTAAVSTVPAAPATP